MTTQTPHQLAAHIRALPPSRESTSAWRIRRTAVESWYRRQIRRHYS